MKTIEDILVSLTEEEKVLLKDTIKYGCWGDSDYSFMDGENVVTDSMYGYCTNEAKKGGHFSGRKVASMFKNIYKKVCILSRGGEGIGEVISHCSDWWGDGSVDMLFIRKNYVDDFERWARE